MVLHSELLFSHHVESRQPPAGLEPVTFWLQAKCSATEPRRQFSMLELHSDLDWSSGTRSHEDVMCTVEFSLNPNTLAQHY